MVPRPVSSTTPPRMRATGTAATKPGSRPAPRVSTCLRSLHPARRWRLTRRPRLARTSSSTSARGLSRRRPRADRVRTRVRDTPEGRDARLRRCRRRRRRRRVRIRRSRHPSRAFSTGTCRGPCVRGPAPATEVCRAGRDAARPRPHPRRTRTRAARHRNRGRRSRRRRLRSPSAPAFSAICHRSDPRRTPPARPARPTSRSTVSGRATSRQGMARAGPRARPSPSRRRRNRLQTRRLR